MQSTTTLSFSDVYANVENELETLEGVHFKRKSPEMAFDAAPGAETYVDLILTFTSAVAVKVFASWLYDKLKAKNESGSKGKSAILSGNKISGDTVTIIQIVNIVESGNKTPKPQDDSKDLS